jgi:hypothetical protein
MATLNEIESQLNTVISALQNGSALGGIELFEINTIEGQWALDNSKTFADIQNTIEAGKLPVLYNISSRGEYLYYYPGAYSVATTDTTTTLPIFYRMYYDIKNSAWSVAALHKDAADETNTLFTFVTKSI